MNLRYAFLVFILVLFVQVDAQYRNFISAPYQWDHEMNVPQSNGQFDEENAFALNEKNRLAIHGRKSQFMNLYFEQSGMIHYKNQAGINAHNAFLLPLAFDPFYEQQFLDIDSKAFAPYFNVKVLFFAGRIKKSNGDIEPAIFRYAFPDKLRIISKQYERVFVYYVQVTNLEPGDVLEYHYKYEIPYDVNWMHFNSGRIFHHSEIAKQDYQFQIDKPKNLRCSFYGDPPLSSWEEDKYLKQLWSKTNLQALSQEPGARLYSEVEHVIFKINENNFDYVYKHPRTNQILPSKFYNYVARQRQKDDFWYRRVALRNVVFDKQSRLFREWIEEQTNEDQDALEKLQVLNADIAQNFQFYKDQAYYALLDFGLERMGEFTQVKRIRDISRHNLYTKIFNRLGFEDYKVLYLLDNRVGAISEDYPTNLYYNERVFYSNDSLDCYVMPKRSRMGYEVNELPFYFQGSNAFGYSLDQLFELGTTAFKTDSIRVFSKLNQRNTEVVALVDLEKNRISFDANIDLRGQWSTLTRAVYLYNEIDSTINPAYNNRLFEVYGDIQLERIEQKDFNPKEDFKCSIELEYLTKRTLRKDEETFFIPLQGMLNYVLWEDINFEKRQTTFYPDFDSEDQFDYTFKFKDDIELQNPIKRKIENESGTFNLEIVQEDEKTIHLNSTWKLKSDPISPEEIGELKEFYFIINELDRLDISLKRMEDK